MALNIVFDIDGVLADHRHRFKLIEQAPKNWDLYYDLMGADTLYGEVAAIMESLGDHHNIFLCTGRPQKFRERTIKWLDSCDLWDVTYRLFMRPDGNFQPNPDVKETMAQTIIRDYGHINMVFEDDTRSVKMWRKYASIVCEVSHYGTPSEAV